MHSSQRSGSLSCKPRQTCNLAKRSRSMPTSAAAAARSRPAASAAAAAADRSAASCAARASAALALAWLASCAACGVETSGSGSREEDSDSRAQPAALQAPPAQTCAGAACCTTQPEAHNAQVHSEIKRQAAAQRESPPRGALAKGGQTTIPHAMILLPLACSDASSSVAVAASACSAAWSDLTAARAASRDASRACASSNTPCTCGVRNNNVRWIAPKGQLLLLRAQPACRAAITANKHFQAHPKMLAITTDKLQVVTQTTPHLLQRPPQFGVFRLQLALDLAHRRFDGLVEHPRALVALLPARLRRALRLAGGNALRLCCSGGLGRFSLRGEENYV